MQITKIVARAWQKGVVFADGTVMFTRQGCSNMVNANINRVFVEACLSDHRVACELFYEYGAHGPQHSANGVYYHSGSQPQNHYLPEELMSDLLNFMELHHCARPAGIRRQIHGYMYGWNQYPYQENDLMLSPFRYDSAGKRVLHAGSGQVVAVINESSGTSRSKSFDRDMAVLSCTDEIMAGAFGKALDIGFHQCEKRMGVDHCMRRLAWLAGTYYMAAQANSPVDAFVLRLDMESPAELTS